MPIKRKYTGMKYGKSKAYRRKRFLSRLYKRRVAMRKQIVSINRTPISYTREIPFNNIIITTGTNWVAFARSFSVSLLPNFSDFSGLFDQYRIRCIVAKFRLVQPPEASNTPATSQFYPDIYVIVDHDDDTVPTSVDTVLQYGKCKRGVLKPNFWFKYRFYPTAALQLYRTATTTAYAPAKNGMFLDLNQSDTPYYGIKGIVSNEAAGLTTAPIGIEFHAVLVVQFKNSR